VTTDDYDPQAPQIRAARTDRIVAHFDPFTCTIPVHRETGYEAVPGHPQSRPCGEEVVEIDGAVGCPRHAALPTHVVILPAAAELLRVPASGIVVAPRPLPSAVAAVEGVEFAGIKATRPTGRPGETAVYRWGWTGRHVSYQGDLAEIVALVDDLAEDRPRAQIELEVELPAVVHQVVTLQVSCGTSAVWIRKLSNQWRVCVDAEPRGIASGGPVTGSPESGDWEECVAWANSYVRHQEVGHMLRAQLARIITELPADWPPSS
jgi:hypothetical protein